MKTIKYIAAVLGLASAAALHATPISYQASVDGLTTPAGVTSFTAGGGALVLGHKNGEDFLGVKSGLGGDEIDVGQSVTVTFDSAEKLASITMVLLFNGPEYKDIGEIASVVAGGSTYYLKVTGENTASWWKGAMFIGNVVGSETQLGGAGMFTVWNPFGNTTVTSMKFGAVNVNPPKGSSNSDYGLSAFSTVPEAGSTLALLGAAVLGLAGIARRRRA